jgi:hypothetical protein
MKFSVKVTPIHKKTVPKRLALTLDEQEDEFA